MRKIVIVFIQILFFVLFFCSCQNDKTISRLSTVDSITQIVTNAEIKLNEVNFDSTYKKYKLYQEYSEKIPAEFYKDKNSINWKYICAYRNVRKPLKNMVQSYTVFRREIDSIKMNLNNLKHDIRKGLMNDAETEKYIDDEMDASITLLTRITSRIESAKKEECSFDTVHPYIVHMIGKSGKKKSNSEIEDE
jgi:hypothetical protein